MKQLFLHIGYPRTGSKTLQFSLFKKHPDINYLGRFPNRKISHFPFLEKIFLYDDENYNKEKVDILKEFNELEFNWSKTNIISDEFFILRDILHNQKVLKKSIFRLNEICKINSISLKVFLNIRNQEEIIKSLYFATYQTSFSSDAKTLLEYLKGNINDKYLENFINYFDYQEKFSLISRIIGKENTTIFLYENLRDSSEDYYETLSKYLNIDKKLTLRITKDVHHHKMDYFLKMDPQFSTKSEIFINRLKILRLNEIFSKDIFLKISKFIIKIFEKNSKTDEEIKHKKLMLEKDLELLTINEKNIKYHFINKNKKLLNIVDKQEILNKYYF